MLQSIKAIFIPPKFTDPDQTRIARLVWMMTIIFFLGTLGVCAFFTYEIPEESLISLTIFISVSCFTILTLCSLQQKKIRLASHLFTFNFLVGLIFNANFYGGLRGVTTAGFVILLIIAGLLMGTRILLHYINISVVSLVILYFLESAKLLENRTMSPIQITDLGVSVAALIISGMLLYTAINSIDKGYALLSNALHKLQHGVAKYPIDRGNPAHSHMFIVNPFFGGLNKMFATHPPTEERIRKLEEMIDSRDY